MNPKNPSVLYAATYDKQRLPWQIVNGGVGTAIYKTTDAGQHWTKLGGGLPAGRIGRIGLDIYLSNPEILYAVIENENPRTGPPADRDAGAPPGRRIDDRGRGLSHGRRRRDVAQDERRQLQRQSEGTVLLQPDLRRPEQRPEPLRHAGRLPALDRRRPHVGRAAGLSAHVRRHAHALDRSAELRPHDSGQRRRHRDLLRRRPHERRLVEHSARVGVLARRGHGGSVQHLRRPAGSRELEGPVERPARTRERAGVARRRQRRRHLHDCAIRTTAAGSTRRGSTAATRAWIRSSATRRRSSPGRPPASRRIASSGNRRS